MSWASLDSHLAVHKGAIDYFTDITFSSCNLHSAILALVAVLLSSSAAPSATYQTYAQEQIVLEAISDQDTFLVEITWAPAEIGRIHVFDIRFVEPETGEEIEDVLYDFSIYGSGDRGVIVFHPDQYATRQEFAFEDPGAYEIRIEDIEGLGESVVIPIQVTPEFHFGAFVLGTIALSMIIVAVSRHNNLFRQQPE